MVGHLRIFHSTETLNSHAAKAVEIQPDQPAVLGDQGRAAQDSKAPDIWLVEKRAAQDGPDPDLWLAEKRAAQDSKADLWYVEKSAAKDDPEPDLWLAERRADKDDEEADLL